MNGKNADQIDYAWLGLESIFWAVFGVLFGAMGLILIYVASIAFGGGPPFSLSLFFISPFTGLFIGIYLASLNLVWSIQSFRKSIIKKIYILLGVSFTIFLVINWHQTHQNKTDIADQYVQFRQAIIEQRYDVAYTYTTLEYQQNHLGKLSNDLSFLVDERYKLHPMRMIWIEGNQAEIAPRQTVVFIDGPVLELEKINGIWYFTGEYGYSSPP